MRPACMEAITVEEVLQESVKIVRPEGSG